MLLLLPPVQTSYIPVLMREISSFLQYLNARAIKSAAFSVLCAFRPLRAYLNYYQDAECFEDLALEGSVRELRIDPVNDYGVSFSKSEIDELLRDRDVSAEAVTLVFKMARLTDVTVLGSSGVTLDNRTGKVLSLDRSIGRMPSNWVVARPLETIHGEESATYINLLWMRKGHRHFAHFFWDLLVPVMVFLKNWRDGQERLIFLVREDLSAIQRDTFRFLEQDYPNVTFVTLVANRKMVCQKSIYVCFQHRYHGVANTLAREYLSAMAELYLRHYAVAAPPAGPGRRLYLSREGAAIRRVSNEPAIEEMLSRYGFESIETGGMAFSQQAELFQSADIIVSPHGAALANLMFCRPGTRILEFFSTDYQDDCYLRICRAMDLDYHFVFGGAGDFPRGNYEINPGELEAALKAMIDA